MPTEPPALSRSQRAAVYAKVDQLVRKKYFDPHYNGRDWPAIVEANRERVLGASDPAEFEAAVHRAVISLGTSHTGFFHESLRRVPGRLAIGVSFVRYDSPQGPCWMALDVHEAGPGHQAGMRQLDVIRAINGKSVLPPEQPMFRMSATNEVEIERDGVAVRLDVAVPAPRSRKQPYSEPTPVITKSFGDVGYLKLAILPGLLGIDVAKEIDRAIASLPQRRFILDLRGHLGGGLAFLRMMSHLTPDKLPVGYTITRKGAERGIRKEALKAVTHIPSSKFTGLARMIVRFAGRDMSVRLITEGLGPKPWHGRAVILINEQTVSAGEMIAAFAQENGLATLVGTTTAGRVIPGSGYKVGHGYRLILPPACYRTWTGKAYEGCGVIPEVLVGWNPDAMRTGADDQLERALELVRSVDSARGRDASSDPDLNVSERPV